MSTAPLPDASPDTLRAEHDALLARLAVRRSIDEVRKGSYLVFAGLLGAGLSVKLAWDRWGIPKPGVVRKLRAGPPILLWTVVAAAIALLVLAIRAFLRARRLMGEEDALHARLLGIRGALGLGP